MSKKYRRFEVLVPLRFNNGEPVPDEALGLTLHELRQKFGAVSYETQMIRGQWQHAGQVYYDELVRVFVDVPDSPENRAFFASFKERLKSRFKQIDIWVTSHPMDVL
jgi:hypothetical protein